MRLTHERWAQLCLGLYRRPPRIWDLPPIGHADSIPLDQIIYTNAKVLLTGDSGAGKSGLAERLVQGTFSPKISTVGAWADLLKLDEGPFTPEDVEREIWLWDFAGQADYRLIHLLYMDETALALLVFNPQDENPFDGLAQWDRDLVRGQGQAISQTSRRRPLRRGPARVSR